MNADLWLPDSELDGAHREFAQSMQTFAEQKLAPHARAIDEQRTFRREMVADLAAAGVLGGPLPRDHGGGGWSPLQLAIARDTLAYQDENLQIADWRVQAGLVSSLDLEQARSQRAQTAATIPQLESSLAATANAISTLIGEPPGRVLELVEATAEVPDPPVLEAWEAPAGVLRRRPDVRGAEAALVANSARLGVARAQLLPLVRLTGSISTGVPCPAWRKRRHISSPSMRGRPRSSTMASKRPCMARWRPLAPSAAWSTRWPRRSRKSQTLAAMSC